MRHAANKRVSKRQFSGRSKKTHKLNKASPLRGGIRL